MNTLRNTDGTSLNIPAHIKTIDVTKIGGLIEIVSINPYMSWRANTTATVMELKCYAKAKLGFRQTASDKWRWSR